MAEEAKVYLDHFIKRENLRYERPNEQIPPDDSHNPVNFLAIKDLIGDVQSSQWRYLRKPDFQRAT